MKKMSHIFRDGTLGHSKRHMSSSNYHSSSHFSSADAITSPFGQLGTNLSDSDLRETAYEIFVASCRSYGSKPLTYISQTEKKSTERLPSSLAALTSSSSSSLQRSLTSTAASTVKRALGLKKSSNSRNTNGVDGGEKIRAKKSLTTGELMRIQMRVSEQTDSRIRRALLRIAAGQLGRRIESMVLPLELLQQFRPSDFPNRQEYEAWRRRNLKVLELGLLLHPHRPLDRSDAAAQQLQKIIRGASEKPIETRRISESMQVLRNTVMSLACRSHDGPFYDTCHWADGVPFNLRLYQMLLEACFDVNEETVIIEEVDEVLELIKKTWIVLGIDQMLHNLCFSWVLFNRFISTGQVEDDLLFAVNNLMVEVEKDVKATQNANYSKILNSALSAILSWAEKKLLSYRDSFQSDNVDQMENTVSLGVSAAKILVEDISYEYRRKQKDEDVACERIDTYIRSSLRAAFDQAMEMADSSRRLWKTQENTPVLSILAQDISELAFSEKEIFSPVLKRWHPLAAGVAVATLHACYGNELKQFVSGISELTPDAILVLRAADKLEKDLVQIAVEDSVDSDDGGKAIIQEMPPYEAEAIMANLVKSWIKARVNRLKEWVDRNLQQEVWNPQANRGRFAPSAVEVLRMVDESLEAFFMLPILIHSVLIPDLIHDLDKCLQHYILKAKSGCGSRTTFVPSMPPLTRCTVGSKFFKKEKKLQIARKRTQVGTTNGHNSLGIEQFCVRINTLQHIRSELQILERRIAGYHRNSNSTNEDDITNGLFKGFELSASACQEGIQQISEAAAYKVVFHDLSPVFWDGLYVGDASASRIDPFLQELEQNLETISATVHDRVRTRAVTDIMKASFDGFLLVLLAGGPSRAFTCRDLPIIEEDFRSLMDLFWSNGDGLPAELIDKLSVTVKSILPLFSADTGTLIEQFRTLTVESYGYSAKSRLPLPPTSGQWSLNEPNTLLRVLCHRNDEIAAKFLKKTYNLPKEL
ncbi:hypothetical protein RJ641_026852 [Dillenia turbinata]|uniref:MHD1 domain-containing protein n=1 Tax=Dillenia turbinata TaxID=194707 RepID=A0AAN8ZPP4_9MAGN